MLNFTNPAYIPDRAICLDMLREVLDECAQWTEAQRLQPSAEMTTRYCTLMQWLSGGTGPVEALIDGPSSAAWICCRILDTLAEAGVLYV